MINKQIQVKNANVSYHVKGSGTGVLLIHGTGGSGIGNWSSVIPRLAEEYTVVAPDYSGSGTTEDDGGKIELEDLVEQTLSAMLNEQDAPFHVVGYSLGAVVAAALAGTYPEKVKSLSLVAGWIESDRSFQITFDFWQKLFQMDKELFAQFIMITGYSSHFFNKFRDKERLMNTIPKFAASLSPGLDRQADLDSRINIRPLLSRITAPTQVIGLTYDQMVPIEQSRALAEAIPGAQYTEIESGHLVFAENPTRLAEVIARFISAHST